ncbi:MAG: PQQ-like beta-propeller repeat protein [Planctomycetes bacterium]|nr:PQQ-like beta-propeller repeat protein [Planctomycetota bacterium]
MFAACCVLLASLVARQEPTTFGEGELDNPTEFEVSASAAGFLADADRQLVELRAGSVADADRERAWNTIFDAWHYALESAGADEWNLPDPSRDLSGKSAVVAPDVTDSRRADGIERAVLRRMGTLDRRELAAWDARFGARATEELARAVDDVARWAAVERSYPATDAAARAATRLCDHAFAAGRFELARAWLSRAERHVELGSDLRATFEPALARRSTALAALATPTAPTDDRADEKLSRSRGFGRARAQVYDRPLPTRWRDGDLSKELRRDAWLTLPSPGATWLASGRLVVQSDDALAVFPAGGDGAPELVRPKTLLRGLGLNVETRVPRLRHDPVPTLTPIAVGDELVIAVGTREARSATARSVVARLAFPTSVLELDPAPAVRWAVGGTVHVDERGRATPLGAGFDFDELEFQPGPAVLETELVWLARQANAAGPRDESRARGSTVTWAVALDLATGRPLWQRRLAVGVIGPREDVDRFGTRVFTDLAPAALVARDGRLFASPHTGVGVLFDAADGRLQWSFQSRRRRVEQPGWLGTSPIDAGDGSWIWTPSDSDRGYCVRAAPDDTVGSTRGSLLAGPPFEIGSLRTILAAVGPRVLAIAAEPDGERLVDVDLASGARSDSFALAQDEHFGNQARVTATRVLVCTDRGLALFDRERELFLLDRIDLGATVTGLVRGGDGIVALGAGTVWRVELR